MGPVLLAHCRPLHIAHWIDLIEFNPLLLSFASLHFFAFGPFFWCFFFTSCPALLSLCSLLKKQLKIDFCFLALSSSLTSSSLFGASSFYYDRDLVNIKTEFLERTHSWLFCLQTFFQPSCLSFSPHFFLSSQWRMSLEFGVKRGKNKFFAKNCCFWVIFCRLKERENKLKQNIYTRTLNRESVNQQKINQKALNKEFC